MAMGMAISLCGLGSTAVNDRNTGCILARWTVTFKYDPFGRRIYKSSTSGTSTFAYDGDNLIEETSSSGAAVARYTQTQNIDEPLGRVGEI
jgi:YD repeat-containing protein